METQAHQANVESQLAIVGEAYEQRPIAMQQRAVDLCEAATRAAIITDEHLAQGADLDKLIQTALKKLDDERTSWVKPLNDYVKKLNVRFKTVTGPLEEARAKIQAKMKDFHREKLRKEQERLAEEQRQRDEAALKEAQRLEAEGKQEEAAEVIEAAADAPAPAPAIQAGPVRGDYGGTSSFVDELKFEVTDEAKVPRIYMSVDEKKIKQSLKEGVREIPGLRIFNDPRVVTR